MLPRPLVAALVVSLLATALVLVGGEDRASAHGTCRHVDVGYTYAVVSGLTPRLGPTAGVA